MTEKIPFAPGDRVRIVDSYNRLDVHVGATGEVVCIFPYPEESPYVMVRVEGTDHVHGYWRGELVPLQDFDTSPR